MSHRHHTCPIAIVGMACRYPDANTVQELFENSNAQRQSFRQIPEGRLGQAYFTESQSADRAYARQAAVLNGFKFDRQWFRVPQSSYDVTDLTHWLALTVAREAIEDIRFRKHSAHPDNEAVRVVVGNTLTGEFSRANVMRLRWPYVRGAVAQQLQETYPDMEAADLSQLLRELEARYKRPFPTPNEDFLAGGLANTIAGRICNHFDFKGGGYTIDGACSSSLLAVADGCSALVSGDADMAIVGGVDLSLDPFELVGFSRSAALARNEMRVYDQRSEGFWPGEGCGFAVLMRYEDAIEKCDRIHAVIRGWGVSSDGRGGLTRPESAGQRLALQRCYRRAGYGIETVGYFEGHGTGTKVGDAAELQALIAARSESGNPICPATIASIKANIGHTKAAAGLAGLLRATQCVSENILPPTTACPQPHALFAESAGTLAPGDRLRDWKADGVARRAGISAMGFGGINTHLTLEEAPTSVQRTVAAFKGDDLARLRTYQDTELFLFSASSRNDLAWTINYLVGFVGECSRAELTDLAVELASRATRGSLSIWRAAATAATPAELARKLGQLQAILDRSPDDSIHLATTEGTFLSGGNPCGRIGLVFPGQGGPARATGGIHARRFDEVRRTYQQAALDEFDRQDDTDFAQPAIVAASLAGLNLLQRIGIQPDVAVGYSLGELVALHWAGCFDDRSLLAMARWRGQATVDDPQSNGAMVALAMDGDRAAAAIGDRENLFVANLVSPRQTVVSGDRAEVEALAARMRREGMTATVLPLQRAFHTPLMAGVAAAFRGQLEGLQFGAVERPVISTVTGQPLDADTDIATYLGEQLLSPVHFLTAAERIAKEVDLFIEVGPGQTMANLTRSICDTPIASLDVGSDSLAPFLNAAAAAYVLGCTPTMANLFSDRFARRFNWGWTPKFLQNPCETVPVELPPEPLELEIASEATVEVPSIATDEGSSTRDRVRQIVAKRTGLPAWTLEDNSRMSSDLHLNSITVGEIVTQAAAATGLQPPIEPTEYANASISDIAAALDRLQSLGTGKQADRPMAPSGVDTWVRYFEIVRAPVPRPERRPDLVQGTWEGFGAIGEREEALLQQLNAESYGTGAIIWLSENPGARDLAPLLQAAQRCMERAQQATAPLCFAIVQSGWGASGFARSFFLENETVSTLVVNLAFQERGDLTDQIAQEIEAVKPGFREVFIDATGRREEPRLSLVKVPPPTTSPINAGDVVLVTGGGKGISAECGYQLARQTGCALLILGRSVPQDSVELANNLDRLRQAKVRVSYQVADVTNAAGVAAAVAKGVADLGSPVTGIIHGAGLNHPRAITNLSLAQIEATVSPKMDGLKNLFAAINPNSLKLLVGFSSIIARTGMHGEADYALGNEWLSYEIEAFQSHHPHCRCRSIEWSVWSGTGMGQRLGRLDALVGQGISPLSVDDGVCEFLRAINTPDLPIRLIVSGRFGNPPTVVCDRPPQKPFRFIDSLPVYYPEIEAIAECRLSPKSDPYLDDHVFDGERLFPAVMALEAMTEVAVVLMGRDAATPLFRDIVFRKAIAISQSADAGEIVLRLAALADPNGNLSLAIRCSTTDFQVNHVEACCILRDRAEIKESEAKAERLPTGEMQPFDPDRCLYGNVLFQTGRFQKIQGYQMIETRRCSGQLSFDGATEWFDRDLPQECWIGDPGIRDAALHGIQVCIPHKIAIPIAAEEVRISRLDPCQPYRTLATEIADHGDELIYDLTIFDRDGRVIESWRKLVLRVVGEPPNLRLNSPFLMAAFVERQIAAHLPQAELKVVIAPTMNERKAGLDPNHRPDGKPDPSANGRFRSAAYSDGWTLAVEGAIPVGCDLQCVPTKQADDWELLLGWEGIGLAKVVADIAHESLDISATRVWTVREAMKKAGLAANAPLVVDSDSTARWVVFNSGDSAIFSSSIFSSSIDARAPEVASCIAVALLSSNWILD